MNLVQTGHLHVPKTGLSGLQVEFALLGASDRAAEIFATRPAGALVHPRAGDCLLGPADLQRIGLEQMRQIEAFLVQDVPLTEIGGNHPNVADRFGQRGGAAGPERTANHPDFRRRGVLRSPDLHEVVGIGPDLLAGGDVEAAVPTVGGAFLAAFKQQAAIGRAQAEGGQFHGMRQIVLRPRSR